MRLRVFGVMRLCAAIAKYSGELGTGFVIHRLNKDESGERWSAPSAITSGGVLGFTPGVISFAGRVARFSYSVILRD